MLKEYFLNSKRKKESPLETQFICLIGPEGAGKSTQSKILKKWIGSTGNRSLKVSIRSGHLLVYLLRRFFSRFKGLSSSFWENRKISSAWKKIYPLIFFLEVIQAFSLALIKVFIPMALGYVIIAEDYVLATYADLGRRCNIYGVQGDVISKTRELLLKLLPKSSLIFFLDADNKTLVARQKERGTPVENEQYLEFRRQQILQITNCLDNAHYINTGGKNRIETQKIIRKKTTKPILSTDILNV